jgi:hypothetical protein
MRSPPIKPPGPAGCPKEADRSVLTRRGSGRQSFHWNDRPIPALGRGAVLFPVLFQKGSFSQPPRMAQCPFSDHRVSAPTTWPTTSQVRRAKCARALWFSPAKLSSALAYGLFGVSRKASGGTDSYVDPLFSPSGWDPAPGSRRLVRAFLLVRCHRAGASCKVHPDRRCNSLSPAAESRRRVDLLRASIPHH